MEVYARHSRNMINIRLPHHRRHRLPHIPFSKLIQRMFLPYRFEIEPRSIQLLLQEPKTPRMRYPCATFVVVFVRGEYPAGFGDSFFVAVGFHDALEDLRGLRVGHDGDRFAPGDVGAGDVD